MSNPTKQKCSICGAPDHTHLHCYGTDAQRPVSSNPMTPELSGLVLRLQEWSRNCLIDGFKMDKGEPTLQALLKEAAMVLMRSGNSSAPETNAELAAVLPRMRSECADLGGKYGITTAGCQDWSYSACQAFALACHRLSLKQSAQETTDQSRTVGEHQSGVALRSPDPANVAGGPRPLPEKASGEPIYECCNESCLWRGLESETVHPKHEPSRFLCPECHEVVELV